MLWGQRYEWALLAIQIILLHYEDKWEYIVFNPIFYILEMSQRAYQSDAQSDGYFLRPFCWLPTSRRSLWHSRFCAEKRRKNADSKKGKSHISQMVKWGKVYSSKGIDILACAMHWWFILVASIIHACRGVGKGGPEGSDDPTSPHPPPTSLEKILPTPLAQLPRKKNQWRNSGEVVIKQWHLAVLLQCTYGGGSSNNTVYMHCKYSVHSFDTAPV